MYTYNPHNTISHNYPTIILVTLRNYGYKVTITASNFNDKYLNYKLSTGNVFSYKQTNLLKMQI